MSGGFTIRTEGGQPVLSLSGDFRTNDQAPDLKVILSPSATPLAALKSAKGAQSYGIPASIDLARQGSVWIWRQKFIAAMPGRRSGRERQAAGGGDQFGLGEPIAAADFRLPGFHHGAVQQIAHRFAKQ